MWVKISKTLSQHNNNNKKEEVVYACNPSYLGSRSRRIMVEATLGKSVRTYLKNNYKQKGLEAWFK
jgi:hypothetical protein